jgi:superfamily I DNA/RNA helicase
MELNPEQLKAVEHTEGPLLILAAPAPARRA